MRTLSAFMESKTIKGEKCNIILIEREDTYEAFLEQPCYPMEFMYGIPKPDVSPEFAMKLAKSNAKHYYRTEEERNVSSV